MKVIRYSLPLIASLVCTIAQATPLKIASYNVKYLTACVNSVREQSLRDVFLKLDADVIALQEIKDRRAIEYFFNSNDWNIIIDDESTDHQNLAFVVKKDIFFRLASGETHNADKRDILSVFIDVPEVNKEIQLLNHHAKSRHNGRITSESMKVSAALEIAHYVRTSASPNIILLGDLNDTPDDASVNTIEQGTLSSLEKSYGNGKAMVNMTESLLEQDYVTYGLNSRAILSNEKDYLSPVIEGSRTDNFNNYSDGYEVKKSVIRPNTYDSDTFPIFISTYLSI